MSYLPRAALAAMHAQLGLATIDQLIETGLSRRTVIRRIERGDLVRIGRRVVWTPAVSLTFEARVLAACLDLGGVASHRTAARLHRVRGFERCDVIELTLAKGRAPARSDLAIVHTSTNLGPDDVVRVGPIPVTSVARTFLGLAALCPEHVSEAAILGGVEAAAREGLVSDRWLWWRLEQLRCRGRNGVAVLERVLVKRADLGPTESWLERRFLEVLTEAGVPLPAVQRRIGRRGAFVARVDFLYDTARLVVEVDGHATHSSREQLTADAARRNQLALAGFTVITFTYDQVVATPTRVVADVRAALDAARGRAGLDLSPF